MIMIVCDRNIGNDHELYWELIGKAKQISNNGQVCVIVGGVENSSIIDNLFLYGADKVYFYNVKTKYSYVTYKKIIQNVMKNYPKALIMFPNTSFCKASAAALSSSIQGGLTADCIEIKKNENHEYIFMRTAINSSTIAEIKCINTDYSICTVKRKVFNSYIKQYDCPHNLEVIHPSKSEEIYNPIEQVISMGELDIITNQIEKSEVVFSVGRGINEEYIKKLMYITKKIGAEMGCTRSVVENGFMPKQRLIGQSGKYISPKLYIAFGISGASQHIVGIQSAHKIISINTDKNAPIFQFSDYAIVTDAHEVIDHLFVNIEEVVK